MGTFVAAPTWMDTQLMIVGAGGALLLLLAFQVFRSARHDVSDSPVSQTWLSEQKRAKSDDGMV